MTAIAGPNEEETSPLVYGAAPEQDQDKPKRFGKGRARERRVPKVREPRQTRRSKRRDGNIDDGESNQRRREVRKVRLPGGEWVEASPGRPDKEERSLLANRRGSRPRLHVPFHRSTTAHASSLYAWGTHPSLGVAGVYLGEDRLGGGGAFCFDAFEAYAMFSDGGTATNTNMMVLGEPGMGKSALLKTLLYRTSAVYGADRFIAIVDVKSEYGELAEVLNIPVIKLSPGGSVRVNPLEVRGDGGERQLRQAQMLEALTETMLGRSLFEIEKKTLWSCLELLAEGSGQPTLGDLLVYLRDLPVAVAEAARRPMAKLVDEISDMAMSVEALVERQFKGMFDGPSTVSIDPDGPGVIIDISAVQQDAKALPLMMVAATAWLQEMLTATPSAKKLQILDESWRMVEYEGTARYLQSCWKLGRSFGIANVAVLHKPSDLGAQAKEGSAASKISQGLVADTSVRVSLRQTTKELDAYADLLGWNETERDVISGLTRGQSLWKIGEKTVQLDHEIADGVEQVLCNTDMALEINTGT